MKPEQLYRQLIELAEKLGITVSEKNLRQVGVRVRSGLCKVHGETLFIMDKHISIQKKVRLLAECLALQPVEELYIVPALRDVLDRHRPKETLLKPSEKRPQEGWSEDGAN